MWTVVRPPRQAVTPVERPAPPASASRWAVASSSTSTDASASSARAIRRRWRSPPLSRPPVLARPGVEPTRERPHRVAEVDRGEHRPQRSSSVVARVGVAEPEVVADRGVEEVVVLGDDRDRRARAASEPHRRARSTPSMRMAPACGSQNRSSSAAIVDLPAPLGPDDRDLRPGGDREGGVVEHVGAVGPVAERDRVELDPPVARRHRPGGTGGGARDTAGGRSTRSNRRPAARPAAVEVLVGGGEGRDRLEGREHAPAAPPRAARRRCGRRRPARTASARVATTAEPGEQPAERRVGGAGAGEAPLGCARRRSVSSAERSTRRSSRP